MIETIIRLFFAHAVTDFALQTECMIDGKSTVLYQRQVPDFKGLPWWYWLIIHSLICGLGVYWATGSIFLGTLEVIAHFLIDRLKCIGRISPMLDQILHLIFRLIYGVMA